MEGFDVMAIVLSVVAAIAGVAVGFAAGFYKKFKTGAASDGVDDWKDKVVISVEDLRKALDAQDKPPE